MSERLVVIVSLDAGGRSASPFEAWPGSPGVRFLKTNVEDAAEIVRTRRPSALAYVQAFPDEAYAVSGLLGVCSESKPRVPVVVVTETYDESEATAYFRMGVEDYLSLRDHRDRIPALLAGIALRSSGGRVFPEITPAFTQEFWESPSDAGYPVVS